MAILPLRCGNSNRADLQQISTSLLAQRGDAITRSEERRVGKEC